MTTLQDVLTPEIREFLDREGILEYLPRAVVLVQECFPTTQGIRAEFVEDPDSDAEWVTLIATMSGTVEEFLERDDHFMDRWIAEMPLPAGHKIVVLPEIL